jgi:hypothetical protein
MYLPFDFKFRVNMVQIYVLRAETDFDPEETPSHFPVKIQIIAFRFKDL